jgi:ornithine cyclodeaminase
MNERGTQPPPLLLDREQTEGVLATAGLMDAVRQALIAISRGEVTAPPRVAAFAPNGLLGVMPAYVPRLGLGAKLVSVFPSGPAAGRTAHRGAMVLFDEDDGRPLLVLDAGPLTAQRTAATALLAAQVLGSPTAGRIAVLGAGIQATAQLRMLAVTHPSAAVLVASRDPLRAAAAARAHPRADAVPSVAAATEGAEVIFCCTDSDSPVLTADDLCPGALLCSVGGSRGPEFDPAITADADVYVEWRGAVSEPPPAGAHELQGLDPNRVIEIGAVLSSDAPVRVSRERITVFKSTGHGALDVAAARAALDQALLLGLGRPVSM